MLKAITEEDAEGRTQMANIVIKQEERDKWMSIEMGSFVVSSEHSVLAWRRAFFFFGKRHGDRAFWTANNR